MSRSLITGIVVTLVLLASLATVFYYNFIRVKDRAAMEAIPNDAAIIIESSGMPQSWSNLLNSDFWVDLQNNESIKKLTADIRFIDSITHQNTDLASVVATEKMMLSFHKSGSGSVEILSVLETGGKLTGAETAAWLASVLNASVRKRNFEKVEVFDIITSGNAHSLFTIAVKDRLLLLSHDGTLVEEGLRKLKYQIPSDTRGLNQAVSLAKAGAALNVYINYKNLEQFTSVFTRSEKLSLIGFFKSFANWSVLDIGIEKEKFTISGITFTDDSLFQFLDLFKTQEPVMLDFDHILPKNTAFALMLGMSDYSRFNTDLNEYLQVNNKLQSYIHFNDSLENRYEIDIAQQLAALTGKKAALFMTEPANDDISKHLVAAIQFTNGKQTGDLLQQYLVAIQKRGEGDSMPDSYNGLPLNRLMLGNFLKLVYGNTFEHIHNPYFYVLNDIVLFANDASVLKMTVDQINSGNVMGADSSYIAFSKGSSRSSNVSLYVSLTRSYQVPSAFANNELLSAWNRFNNDFKKAEHFSIQYAATSNKAFYTTVNLKYNPSFKEESKQIWSVKLDTALAVPPAVVFNSALKQNGILAQDVLNNLYYVSNSGTILWKTKLGGRINSQVYQVDVNQNGSTQYLFSTSGQMMLIDETGKNMTGYPVRFPGKATSGISLFDFYGDSLLTVFVPLDNKRIMGYQLNGKPLTGWNPKIVESKVNQPLKFTGSPAGPLIYASTESNKTMVFNAKGEKYLLPLEISSQSARFPHFDLADSLNSFVYFVDSSSTLNKVKIISNRVVDDVAISLKDTPVKAWYIINRKSELVFIYETKGKCFVRNLTNPDIEETSFIYGDSTYTGASIINTDGLTSLITLHNGGLVWYEPSNTEPQQTLPVSSGKVAGMGDVLMDRNKYVIYTDNLNNLILYRLK